MGLPLSPKLTMLPCPCFLLLLLLLQPEYGSKDEAAQLESKVAVWGVVLADNEVSNISSSS